MVAEQTGAGRFLDAQSVYYFWKNVFNVTLHCCLVSYDQLDLVLGVACVLLLAECDLVGGQLDTALPP